MSGYQIVAVCGGGHSQVLRVHEILGRAAAEGLATLLDGTSPMYLQRPGADSVVGKCGICGAAFRCQVVGGAGCAAECGRLTEGD